MPQLIQDYAIIGNEATAALIAGDGSIDWLCFPRFDSGACFAALLGATENGRWLIGPKHERLEVKRHYVPNTMVLETTFTTEDGVVTLTDAMGRRGDNHDVIRIVTGVAGTVPMVMDLLVRFDYGTVVPWVTCNEKGEWQAIAGPDRVVLDSPIPLRGEDMRTRGEFRVEPGQKTAFTLTWSPSHQELPAKIDPIRTVEEIQQRWTEWSKRMTPPGKYSGEILQSLLTLKTLTHHSTGGIVAAATTSLPEEIGGVRNWDYRYCWLRDSTFTLIALMQAGFTEEARLWRDWLTRAIAGSPDQMQIMYGVAGERRLKEFEIPELSGYQGSKPVRVGNAASEQLQLDVYGEVLDAFYQAQHHGLEKSDVSWNLQRSLVNQLEKIWHQPDEGIWEVRGPRRHFVHSKVMAWVGVDRAVRSIQEFGEEGPLERWIRLRADIHAQVCRFGFSLDKNSFVQYYGSKDLDASLLLLPLVGFLPPEDPRIQGTVAAIEKELLRDGLVARYNTHTSVDGLPGEEGSFLACSFWLVDNYVQQGRLNEARKLFEYLLSLRNDVGLLSEEYNPREQRQLGNFPQAFSHLALVVSAFNMSASDGRRPAHRRSRRPVAGRSH